MYEENGWLEGFSEGIPEGSVLSVLLTGTKVIMKNDRVFANIGKEGTIYSRTLHTLAIYNSKFINNIATRNVPGILVQEEIVNFTCIGTVFLGNEAEFEGILTIKYAHNIFIDSNSIKNNIATFGKMIDVKESRKFAVVRSDFANNYCSGVPCAVSVMKSEEIVIESCSFASKLLNESDSQSVHSAVEVDSKYVTIKKSTFFEIEGNVLKGLADDGIFLENISSSCPENHYFERVFTGIDSDIVTNRDRKMSALELQDESSVVLNCAPCAKNHYRIGISTYSLERDVQENNVMSTQSDVCFKCPPGGICKDKSIVADVNYWGFIDGNKLSFVFCTAGHCCQNAPCPSYDTCNEGREGRLCTSCIDGRLLGIVSDDCVLVENCVEGWLYAVVIVTGIVYIGILLIKVESLNVLQMVYRKVTERCNRKGERYKMEFGSPAIEEKGNGLKNGFNEDASNGDVKTEPPQYVEIEPQVEKNWIIPCDTVEIFHIIVFHLQDTALFQIRFPGMPAPAYSLGEYKDKIVSLARLDSLAFSNSQACLPEGVTELTKLFIKISIIPFMICVFLVSVLFVKGLRSGPQIKKRLMSSAYTVFLLIVLFSSQQLSMSALNLVNCVDLGSGKYLKIDTSVKCYELWQWFTFAYILLFIFPLWLALLIASGLLRQGVISVRTFLLGMLFPGPFMIYSAVVIYRERKNGVKALCQPITVDYILGEVWYSYRPFFGYRYLCWGGIVELRRLALVILATLVPDPIPKVTCMTLVVIVAFWVHSKFHPYSDRTANACANISLAATILVGMLNFGWATLLYAGSGFDYGIASTIGEGLATFETALAEVVPAGIFLFCCGQALWVNLVPKKNEQPYSLQINDSVYSKDAHVDKY